MQVSTELPPDYIRRDTIDLTKNKIATAIAIVTFIVLFLAVGWLLIKFTDFFRPGILEVLGSKYILTNTPEGSEITFTFQLILDVVIALILVMLLHEPVHGMFYWRFAGKRPEFNFKALGVYVASPSDVYYPRNKYLIVGIAPLVLLSIIGLLLIMIVPDILIPILIFFVAFNAAGAGGDLVMITMILSYSSDTLMQDIGTSVIVYEPRQTD